MREKIYADEKTSRKEKSETKDFEVKILRAEEELAVLSQVVGGDFGMSVKFGRLGSGSFYNPETAEIILDPRILAENKKWLARFVAGHEGGHRAISKSLEQIGLKKEKAVELYDNLGFGYLGNCEEDCATNDWVSSVFERFKDSSDKNYREQFEKENTAMTTPEIQRIMAMLGYTLKFVSFGSEIIRKWAIGRYSKELDENVRAALKRTEAASKKYWREIPEKFSKGSEREDSARERFKIFYEKIWPEAEKLVKMDIDREKMRELAKKMMEQMKERKGEKGEGEEAMQRLPLPKEMREELEKAMNEKEGLKKGEKNSVPWDKLSDELKKKLQKIYNKLPKEVREELEKKAKENLEDLEDELIKASRGKLSEDENPSTHEELDKIKAELEKEKVKEEEIEKALKKSETERKKIKKELEDKITGDLAEYDKIYREVAPLADKLYNRIHQIFLPHRHPRWVKGFQTGHRLDLAKVMQFQADRSLYDKIWERKTIPQKIDYRFTLLVDLSSSMRGKTIEQTFRGVIVLAEVLNRLGIKAQILGFQDDIMRYKEFDDQLSHKIRQDMAVMRKEVNDMGNHNRSGWNSDGYCLKKASEMLSRQKGKDNFLIVLSDGLPAPDQAHAGPEYELSKVIEAIRSKTKQKLIGVGLGSGTEHVANYYPISLPSTQLKEMPMILGDLLEDMIKFPDSYR